MHELIRGPECAAAVSQGERFTTELLIQNRAGLAHNGVMVYNSGVGGGIANEDASDYCLGVTVATTGELDGLIHEGCMVQEKWLRLDNNKQHYTGSYPCEATFRKCLSDGQKNEAKVRSCGWQRGR